MIGNNSLLTRIRIWKSGYFLESYYSKKFVPISHINVAKSFLVPFPLTKGVQSNIGLISIETREIYVSLWPEGVTVFNKYKSKQNFVNDINLILDKQLKCQYPDYIVDLCTLDVDSIKQKLDGYGNNRFLKKYLEANNYSGLAYDLLISGGIPEAASVSWETVPLGLTQVIAQLSGIPRMDAHSLLTARAVSRKVSSKSFSSFPSVQSILLS